MTEKPIKEVTFCENGVEEGFINVTGGKIWYRIVGKDQSGIPILCVHGGPGVPHNYLTPMELFAEDRPVILFDQLGCGLSERPEDTSMWTIDFFADEINEVRAALDLDEIVYFGQSWGSMVGSYYLVNRTQEGIKAVVFGGPVMATKIMTDDCARLVNELGPELSKAVWDAEAAHDYSSEGFAAAMDEFYNRHVCRLPVWPDYVNKGTELTGYPVYNTMWGPSEFICTGNLIDFDMMPYLDQIKVPVLYTCGEFDECTPESSKLYSESVPDGTLIIFEGGSHMHHVEFPELYKEKVTEWLKEHGC